MSIINIFNLNISMKKFNDFVDIYYLKPEVGVIAARWRLW